MLGERRGALLGDAIGKDALVVAQKHRTTRASAHRHAIFTAQLRRHAVERGKVGALLAHGLVRERAGALLDDKAHQDVLVVGHVHEPLQGHDAAFVQLDVAVHGEKRRDDVGEAHATPQASAERGAVAELDAHDILERRLDGAAGIGVKAGVGFHLAQGDHGADAELLVGLLDGIQAQIAQVDGGAKGMVAHLHPHHAGHHAIALLLVQLPSLLQALRANVFLKGNNGAPRCLRFIETYILYCGRGILRKPRTPNPTDRPSNLQRRTDHDQPR